MNRKASAALIGLCALTAGGWTASESLLEPCELCVAVSFESEPTHGIPNQATIAVTNVTPDDQLTVVSLTLCCLTHDGAILETYNSEVLPEVLISSGDTINVTRSFVPDFRSNPVETHRTPYITMFVSTNNKLVDGSCDVHSLTEKSASVVVPGLSVLNLPTDPIPPGQTYNLVYRVSNEFDVQMEDLVLYVTSYSDDVLVNDGRRYEVNLPDLRPRHHHDVSVDVKGVGNVKNVINARVTSKTAAISPVLSTIDIGNRFAETNQIGHMNAAAFSTPRQQTDAERMPEVSAEDLKAIDAVIQELYASISGPAGQKRDRERMAAVFAENARLCAMQPASKEYDAFNAMNMTPDEYADRSIPLLEKSGFTEAEIGRTLEIYGTIAHAFSAYEGHYTNAEGNDQAVKGINSIQLVKVGGEWKVYTILWDQQWPEGRNPVPDRYIDLKPE